MLVDENPVTRAYPIRLKSRVPVYLEIAEIEGLLDAAKTYDEWTSHSRVRGSTIHDIILTYLKTGMRLEELRHLEWKDVNFEGDEIHIRQEKQVETARMIKLSAAVVGQVAALGRAGFAALSVEERRHLLGRQTMAGKYLGALTYENFDLQAGILQLSSRAAWKPKTTSRIIPISPGLKPVLDGQPRTCNLVFPDPDGGLWRFTINKIIQRCAQKAGITKDIHTHILRHTFATQLRRMGVPLETIKELLGHANIRHTLIYAHFSPVEAQTAIPKIDCFGGSQSRPCRSSKRVIPLVVHQSATGTH
jgi:integrase